MEKQRVDAFLVRGDPHILEGNIAQVVSLAATHRIPAMYPWRTYVEAGGLMSYAVLGSIAEVHHRSAAFVDRILKGANPAEMPVEQPGFSGGDRTNLEMPKPEEDLVQAVAAGGKPLVVVTSCWSMRLANLPSRTISTKPTIFNCLM